MQVISLDDYYSATSSSTSARLECRRSLQARDIFEVSLQHNCGPLGLLVIEDGGRLMVQRVFSGPARVWNERLRWSGIFTQALQKGVQILSINGNEVTSLASYYRARSAAPVAHLVCRKPEEVHDEYEVTVRHDKHPLGLLLREVGADVVIDMVLDGVLRRSGAQVCRGDILLSINGLEVPSIAVYHEARLATAEGVTLRCRRGDDRSSRKLARDALLQASQDGKLRNLLARLM